MRHVSKLMVFAALPGLLILFQNCSKTNFQSIDEEQASYETGQDTPVVCDPFGGGRCASDSSGLAGRIYSYPNGVGVQNYIDFGIRLNALVILSEINVPTRDFKQGFPASNGSVLVDAKGDKLVEYFGLDLQGKLTLDSGTPPGDYQFALMSDDGSILTIDNETIVNNDGTHGPHWACATTPVTLQINQPHPIRVRYYQGPQVQIALQLFYRPWSERSRDCQEGAGWQIVPAKFLSH